MHHGAQGEHIGFWIGLDFFLYHRGLGEGLHNGHLSFVAYTQGVIPSISACRCVPQNISTVDMEFQALLAAVKLNRLPSPMQHYLQLHQFTIQEHFTYTNVMHHVIQGYYEDNA